MMLHCLAAQLPLALDLTSALSLSITGITCDQLVVGTDCTVTVSG
jgi:hypothetical protein